MVLMNQSFPLVLSQCLTTTKPFQPLPLPDSGGETLRKAVRSQLKLRGNSEPHATAETWRAMAQICMRKIKIAVELCRCLFKSLA